MFHVGYFAFVLARGSFVFIFRSDDFVYLRTDFCLAGTGCNRFTIAAPVGAVF
jgi:hypothetical protein